MTQYQTSIIWLGLILIALNLIVNIEEVKSVIFKGSASSTNASDSSSGNVVAPGQFPVQTPTGTMV